jgi:hypothetical protein
MPGNAQGMRLFLFGLWFVALAACKSEDRREAAVRVDLSYATFRPGCLTLTASDKADPSRSTVQVLSAPESADGKPPRSRELTVAVYRQDDWSHELTLTAEASESDCAVEDRKSVATESVDVRVPEEGIAVVALDLRAMDLDDDGFVASVDGRGSDCDDADPDIKPGQSELCNGKDDNCDGLADETFRVGAECTTAVLGCAGTLRCAPSGTSAECESSQTPVPWFKDRDGDGDGDVLSPLGNSCVAPETGAVTASGDCDDDSRFVSSRGSERCDGLDNDCDRQKDEDGVCASVEWNQILTQAPGGQLWLAVAAHGERQAWVAGNDQLIHVANDTATPYADCLGSWISAWARPTDGRVFLGSVDGKLASRAVGSMGCDRQSLASAARINGLVGFEEGNSTLLFAVTNFGRIYRWNHPSSAVPVEVDVERAGNSSLRAIHGTRVSNMLAVGTQDGLPKVLRATADGSKWVQETLPTGLPSGTTLQTVYVVHDDLAFAAGTNGVVLKRGLGGVWTKLDFLDTDIQGLTAYGSTAVYVVTTSKTVTRYDGTWSPVHSMGWTPTAIDGVGPQDLWVVGSTNQIIRWGP